MFFYQFENLDNFINNSLEKSIVLEKERINNIISLYDEKKENLLNITNNIISVSSTINKDKVDFFYDMISLLKKSFEDLENISICSKSLKNNLDDIYSSYNNLSNNFNEIKADLVEYNKQDEKLNTQILEYEKEITYLLNKAIELILNIDTSFDDCSFIENLIQKEADIQDLKDNDVLIISEKEQIAYLPYKVKDIEKIYRASKREYTSLEDVIQKLYKIPLNKFKNSSISRFREAFQLIKNKENGSVLKALDLGLELIFNYDLNPIIIAACRNLDELDIYLDCLEENELDEFNCFEIKFEVAPQIVKK